jgi:hypothetical protein
MEIGHLRLAGRGGILVQILLEQLYSKSIFVRGKEAEMRQFRCIGFAGVLALTLLIPMLLGAQDKKEGGEIYTIKQGDTLWEISQKFLNDPFLWPKLWQRNPYITNPHWIYPGRPLQISPLEEPKTVAEGPQKQLPPKEVREVVVQSTPPAPVVPQPEPKSEPKPVEEKRFGFPDIRSAGFFGDLDYAGIGLILDSKEGKSFMSAGDITYLSFRSSEQVGVGAKFTVFRGAAEVVRDPRTGRGIGRRYNILGNVQVIDLNGNFYTARVIEAFDAIQRGDLLKPYDAERMEGILGKK